MWLLEGKDVLARQWELFAFASDETSLNGAVGSRGPDEISDSDAREA